MKENYRLLSVTSVRGVIRSTQAGKSVDMKTHQTQYKSLSAKAVRVLGNDTIPNNWASSTAK